MNCKHGFTLVELLVVIAIISILAAIAIPSVSGFIEDAQVGNAEATARNIETAVTGILADAGRKDFRSMFTQAFRDNMDALNPLDINQFQSATNVYTDMMYRLLRQGRNAFDDAGSLPYPVPIQADILQKLSASYMPDLDEDPWGNRYTFFLGPLRRGAVPLRKYRIDPDNPTDSEGFNNPIIWNQATKQEFEERTVPGLPAPDDAYGMPADADRPVYVWSFGGNLEDDQGFFTTGAVERETLGGGDDINNWDNSGKGWDVFY